MITPMPLEYYKNIARILIEQDQERDTHFKGYEDMYHLNYQLPDEVRRLRWVRTNIAQDPHDAISAGKRVLSSIAPKIKFQPLADSDQDRTRAGEIEKNLQWQLLSINDRRSSDLVDDIVESALLYHSVAAMVIDLDWHIKQMKAQKRDTKRLERARKQGRFIVNLYHPMSVHVRKTSYGVEGVLLQTERTAVDVIEEWGDPTGELQQLAENNETIVYNDWIDWDNRAVWVEGVVSEVAKGGVPVRQTTTPTQITVELLEPSPHKLDFMPWVALMGSSSLESEIHNQYHPMLYPVYRSRSWETLNIARSLVFSDVIAKASKPDIVEEGSNLARAQIDYTDASKTAKAPPGNTLKAMPSTPLDPGKTEMVDRLKADIERSTVSQILYGGGISSQIAFASLNLATQTAVGALKPPKALAEKAMAKIFKLILLWTSHTGSPLIGYNNNKGEDEYGMQLSIEPDELEEESIYLTVELTPDVPTDRQQRANTAGMMVQWGYPKELALEDVGVEDPQRALRVWHKEQIQDAKVQDAIRLEQSDIDMQIQEKQMELDLAYQEQLMALQQPQQQEAQPSPDTAMMDQMMQGAEMMGGGQGNMAGIPGGAPFAPNFGGLPPGMGNPEATVPGATTGVDREGQPIRDVEAALSGEGEGMM